MLNELRKIRYARFRLEMTAASQLRLPPYKGSTFRGAFGHTFQTTLGRGTAPREQGTQRTG